MLLRAQLYVSLQHTGIHLYETVLVIICKIHHMIQSDILPRNPRFLEKLPIRCMKTILSRFDLSANQIIHPFIRIIEPFAEQDLPSILAIHQNTIISLHRAAPFLSVFSL